jgi:predicted transcriptional regulator
VDESSGRLQTELLLKEISIQIKIDDKNAILQRLQEQRARGALTINARGRYELTSLGKMILHSADGIAYVFNLDGFNRNKISIGNFKSSSP